MHTARDSADGVAKHVGNAHGLRLALGLCLCYSLCMACLRGYIRWRTYHLDDYVVLASTILALASFGCGYASANTGLGLPTSQIVVNSSALHKLNENALAGNILWIVSLCLSKAAIVAILWRTTQTPAHRRVQLVALAFISIQCLSSIALLATGCAILEEAPAGSLDQCSRDGARWKSITGLDIATEGILLFLPVHLTWRILMSTKSKCIVIFAFWLRLPTIVFSIFRHQQSLKHISSSDPSLTGSIMVVWQSVELSYSLAAATIVALKTFTQTLNTGFGHIGLGRVHESPDGIALSGRGTTLHGSNASKKVQNETISTMDSMEPIAPVR